MHRVLSTPTLSLLLIFCLAITCAAQSATAPRVVDLTAADGTNLRATYFAAAKTGPGVILFHQCNQRRQSWDNLAARLAAAGINVLTLDYRGFGESGGKRYDQLTPQETQKTVTEMWPGDVDKAFEYLVSQPGREARRYRSRRSKLRCEPVDSAGAAA